jgi:hypothetical protein
LDYKDRLDSAVQTYAAPSVPKKTVKKPYIGTFKRESSLFSSSAMLTSSLALSKSRHPSQRAQPSRARVEPSPELSGGGHRRTINSMTSHTLVYNERIPPPNTELKIPDPPSRSPSPPTDVIVGTTVFVHSNSTQDTLASPTTEEDTNSLQPIGCILLNSSNGD